MQRSRIIAYMNPEKGRHSHQSFMPMRVLVQLPDYLTLRFPGQEGKTLLKSGQSLNGSIRHR
jgi:hypothetical protein